MTKNDWLSYKGFTGSAAISSDGSCLYGEIRSITAFVTYEARSLDELKQKFKNAVDDYIAEHGDEYYASSDNFFEINFELDGAEDHISGMEGLYKVLALNKEAVEDGKDGYVTAHVHLLPGSVTISGFFRYLSDLENKGAGDND